MKARGTTRATVKPAIRVRASRGSISRHYGKYRAEVMVSGVKARRTFATEEEAQLYLLDVCRQSLTLGISLDKTRVTLQELMDLYYQTKENAGRKSSTLGGMRVSMRHIGELLGGIPAAQLLPEHVDRLLSHLKRNKRLCQNYVSAIHALLSGVLEFGVRRQVLGRNVARMVDRPRLTRARIKVMAQADLQRFLGVLEDVRDRAIFYLFLTTGMRKGELVGLKWDDFDPQTGRLTIRRRVIRSRLVKGMDIDAPKTAHGFRVNKLPPEVVDVLARWRAQQDLERRIYRRWSEAGWLFTSRQNQQAGKHLDPTTVNWLLNRYLERAGISEVTVHGLRHSFCTWLLQRGVSARDVQEAVGHSKVSVTLDLYWEATAGSQERVSGEVGEIVFPEVSPKTGTARHLRLISG